MKDVYFLSAMGGDAEMMKISNIRNTETLGAKELTNRFGDLFVRFEEYEELRLRNEAQKLILDELKKGQGN